MRKEFHYHYEDAQASANAFANENGYTIAKNEISASENTMQGCTYMDDEADNLCWGGEVSAISVEDNNGNIQGIFAYWE